MSLITKDLLALIYWNTYKANAAILEQSNKEFVFTIFIPTGI